MQLVQAGVNRHIHLGVQPAAGRRALRTAHRDRVPGDHPGLDDHKRHP
jgi:hypothetical protein